MKIVDVSPFFYPYMGGIERRVDDVCRIFSEQGHDVTVLASKLPDTTSEEKYNGYTILRLDSKFINLYNPPYVTSKDVLETLNSIDADIVNFNYRWAPSFTKDLKKYDGKKVFTYHNMWGEGTGLQSKLSEINDNAFRKTLNTFDHIIAVSDSVRNDLIHRGYSPEYVTTVNTVTTVKEELNDFSDVGNGEGDFILSLGRLVRTKGLDYLIEAMVDVDYKLIMCGKGPDENRLRKKIKKYNLEDRIEMKGFVSEEERSKLMKSCKFFVMPSLFESLGLAAIELMSNGRPVLCTDVNGLPDTVGEGGFIVKSKDSKELSRAINYLLENPDKLEELTIKARIKSKEYDWKYLFPKIEEVYDNVISGRYSEKDSGQL